MTIPTSDDVMADLQQRLDRMVRLNENKVAALRNANIMYLRSHGEEDIDPSTGHPRQYSWELEYKETEADALRDDAMQWRDGSTIDEMDKEQP